MNFNYSYRAFLITSLLFGILFLLMTSINLSKYKEKAEEIIDVDYTIDQSILEEEETEDLATITNPPINAETHRAFNEAEEFIKEIEQEREEFSETTEGKLEEIEAAIEDSQVASNGNGIIASNNKQIRKKEVSSSGSNKKETVSTIKSSNRNSTNSYRLINRTALYFPNPVYTCEGGGKVVIAIEVNEFGTVKKASYNSRQSTTTNQCLIDSALEYASLARFTTDASREKQLGTITYNFPGQD